jgi:hypothetical protein
VSEETFYWIFLATTLRFTLAMANLRLLRNDYIRFSLLFPPKKRIFVFSFFLFYTIINEDVRFASIL